MSARVTRLPLFLLLAITSCTCPPRTQQTTTPVSPPPGEPPPTPAPPATGERKPAVDKANPHYARVEGEGFKNDCQADAACKVGGCSSEVCTAEEGVSTTCELPAEGWPIKGATCGCFQGQCQWVTVAAPTSAPAGQGVAQGQSCKDAPCAPGLTCVKYFGVAGPSGPEFATCEVPCADGGDAKCPQGQKCTTIADGPGQVCR